ncbi:Ig heavy chain V region 914 [Labeo rohita]|uniref:Ig heavy chain V region 914 n=1 Tax=Labeo rohita TaxID=84645 RepID=UPI0021E2F9D9|nr:Ig heavy chain V region 914 [Labeo rohita]
MKNILLLLILFNLNCLQCQKMESIESTVVKRPGETLTLSCRGSGFSFDCCNMHWIRQQAGKPLVWMGLGYSSGSGHKADSFKGRLENSRDDSKSMMFLKLSGLTEEDTAVYYCARESQ